MIEAKKLSKVFKIVSGTGLLICTILKWCNFLPNATVGEICMVWSVIYGLGAGTIDFNLIIDKFTRNGEKRNEQTCV